MQDSEIRKTYSLKGWCSNCGHEQKIVMPKGKESPSRVDCENCGCYTMKPQAELWGGR